MAKVRWGIGLAVLAFGGLAWSATAQQPLGGAAISAFGGRELQSHLLPIDGKGAALVIVDPQTRAIGVYQINRETNEVQLKSVRNFSADLQLEAFNSGSPSPKEIREGLERVQ